MKINNLNSTVNHKQYRNIELIIFIILVSLSTFSTDIYVPALPSMVHFFNTTPAVMQQTLLCYMYGFSISMLLSGIVADYLGRKTVLLIGISLYAFCSLLALLAQSPWQLDCVRFFQGLGGCCGTVIVRVIVREKFSSQKAVQTLSYLSAGMSISLILAPIIGGIVIKFFNWRTCFGIMFILGTFLWFGIQTLEETKVKVIKKSFKLSCLIQEYAVALKDRHFIFNTVAISLSWGGLFILIVEYPFILIQNMQYSTGAFGFIFAFIMMGYFLGAFILQKRNFSVYKNLQLGMFMMILAAVCGSLCSLFNQNIIVITIPAFIYLTGLGILMPNSQFAALTNTKIISATTTSLIYFIEMLFTAIASNIVKSYFYPSLCTTWLIILILMIFLCLLFRKYRF